jgi:hypothetical protein
VSATWRKRSSFTTHGACCPTSRDPGVRHLITGGRDHTVPEAITKSTLKEYRHSSALIELLEFPDPGQSLTIDHGSPEVADASLAWLEKHGVAA